MTEIRTIMISRRDLMGRVYLGSAVGILGAWVIGPVGAALVLTAAYAFELAVGKR